MPRPHITVDTDLDIPGTVALGMWVSQGWVVASRLCVKVITKKSACFAQNRASKKYR